MPGRSALTLFGYARVSTLDQDLAIQRAQLQAAGCSVIRAEKKSGVRRTDRTELIVLLEFLREGDTLPRRRWRRRPCGTGLIALRSIVTRVDRLARSLKGLQNIVHERKVEGMALKAAKQPVDIDTAVGTARNALSGDSAQRTDPMWPAG